MEITVCGGNYFALNAFQLSKLRLHVDNGGIFLDCRGSPGTPRTLTTTRNRDLRMETGFFRVFKDMA